MNHCSEDNYGSLVSHHQSAKVLQPGIGALNDPTTPVSAQLTTVLMGRFAIVSSGGNNRLNTSFHQSFSRFIAVICPISNQTFRGTLQLCLIQLFKRSRQQSYFRRGRRVQVNSERSTRAICQYHKLCSLAAFGFADCSAPFFAEMKVPSIKHSFQRIIPSSFNLLRKARHKLSKVPSAAHWLSRRWTVLGLPYCSGNSLQGAPVHSIHKMPSKHLRSSARGRPPLVFTGCSGRCDLTAAHCCDVNCFQAIGLHLQLVT